MDRSTSPSSTGPAGAGRRAPARPAAAPDVRSRVSLRQLEAFCAVMTAGGASAAAARLARTQSAVSTAIAELEGTLGTPLFERSGRGLRPTDAARRLLPHALEVVERARRIDQSRQGLACGLAACRSVARALSQACTSAAS